MVVVVVGLVLSGLTAFPLEAEVGWLASALERSAAAGMPLAGWVAYVHEGLQRTYDAYPFVGYGTDWLAFGHLVIALFFVGPCLYPRRDHRWLLISGLIACVAVLPTAMFAGEVRQIPWPWRIIDMSFGVFGFVPLALAYRLHKRVLAAGRTTI